VMGLSKGTLVVPSLDKIIGSFIEGSVPALSDLIKHSGGNWYHFLAPSRYANCGILMVQLPDDTTNVSLRVYGAEGDKNYKECIVPVGDFLKCAEPAGYSAWIYKRQGAYLAATYKNWSHDRARNGRIELYGVVWPRIYKVVAGDSLSKIAVAVYGLPHWSKIYRANRKTVKMPGVLFPGELINLPPP
jgi:LysM domain